MKTFTGEIPSRAQLQAWDDRDEELRQGREYEEKGEWRLSARERAQMKNPPERFSLDTGKFEPNPALL